MIDGKKVLAVITARGGSKRLPGKNIAELQGHPMVSWSVFAAKASRYLDRVILSSDDDEIIEAAKAAGCDVPFRRPKELASDTSSTTDTLIHALESIGEDFDYLVLLQATSPLRIPADIDACIELAHRTTGSAITVTECKPPEWIFHVDEHGFMNAVLNKEGNESLASESMPSYIVNGAVYVTKVSEFLRSRTLKSECTQAHIMPRERSIDIDTPLDLLIARAIASEMGILHEFKGFIAD